MPHMVLLSVLPEGLRRHGPGSGLLGPLRCTSLAKLERPARLDDLARTAQGQRARGHVLGDGAAGGDVRALADRDGRDQRGVAADERARFDPRGVLVGAVVVAGDGPGPDVHPRTYGRVADVGKVRRLGPVAEGRLLQLDEIADLGFGPD